MGGLRIFAKGMATFSNLHLVDAVFVMRPMILFGTWTGGWIGGGEFPSTLYKVHCKRFRQFREVLYSFGYAWNTFGTTWKCSSNHKLFNKFKLKLQNCENIYTSFCIYGIQKQEHHWIFSKTSVWVVCLFCSEMCSRYWKRSSANKIIQLYILRRRAS